MKKIYLYILIFFLCPAAGPVHAYTQEECIQCHGKEGGGSLLRISVEEFRNSIHGDEIECQGCHSGIDGKEHESAKGSGVVDCGQCHEKENRHGLDAGQDEDRPQCHSCHGRHNIPGRDEMFSAEHESQLKESCRECHPLECEDSGYLAWFPSLQLKSHKKQDFSMNYDRDNCIGCHQGGAAHGEIEPLDSQNCHVCHMNMKGPIQVTGYIHPRADLRKQPVTFASGVIYQIFILIAFIIMIVGFFRRRSAWLAGRSEHRPGSLSGLFGYILGHGRILEKRERGISHLFVFWGFLIPVIIIILAQFGFILPVSGARILSFLTELAGIGLLTGTGYLLNKRLSSRDQGGPKRTLFPMFVIIVIIITGFSAEAIRLGITNPAFTWSSPFGWTLSLLMPPSPAAMLVMIRIHFLAVLVFIASLPFTFSRHLAAVTLNVFYKKKANTGELKAIPLDNGITGAGRVKDFSWKQLLDAEACVACGRCEENCPAFISGKTLSPRRIIRDILYGMESTVIGGSEEVRISEDEIWSCTTCMACVAHCPVFAEPMDKIIDMRRYMVMGKGRLPDEARALIRNLEIFGDVNGRGAAHRVDWAFNRNVPLVKTGGSDHGVLLWVGCSGAFHPRYREVARAMVHVMRTAGIRFSILGKEELCCGDPARRLGEESLFLELAGKNIQRLEKYGVKEIVAICPHCFNTLKNEYPGIGGYSESGNDAGWKTYHAAEYIVKLINERRIIPRFPVNKNITFHDPCYLGRINDLYDPPRDIIKALPGTRFMEIGRNQRGSFCCGGGGGGMWLHERQGRRMNSIRAEEVLDTGAELLATACPYCLTMLDDGINSLDREKTPGVMDIVEILADSI